MRAKGGREREATGCLGEKCERVDVRNVRQPLAHRRRARQQVFQWIKACPLRAALTTLGLLITANPQGVPSC
jgi:hypothetical protein